MIFDKKIINWKFWFFLELFNNKTFNTKWKLKFGLEGKNFKIDQKSCGSRDQIFSYFSQQLKYLCAFYLIFKKFQINISSHVDVSCCEKCEKNLVTWPTRFMGLKYNFFFLNNEKLNFWTKIWYGTLRVSIGLKFYCRRINFFLPPNYIASNIKNIIFINI